MNYLSDVASETSLIECPSCGSNQVTTTSEIEHFQYGDKAEVTLSAQINVHHCKSCDFAFTTEDASEARHNAVCRHFGVLTPSEVREVRDQYSLSQAEFSELSKIGKASLARWESGVLIQNQANDNLLYLLTYAENLARLRDRKLPGSEKSPELTKNLIHLHPKFRCLPITEVERLKPEADRFELFPKMMAR